MAGEDRGAGARATLAPVGGGGVGSALVHEGRRARALPFARPMTAPAAFLRAVLVRSGIVLSGAAGLAVAPVHAEESQPVSVHANYTSDVLSNVSGGIERGTRVLGLLSVETDVDGAAFGASWLSGRLTIEAVHGRPFSDVLSGDFQGISNIEAPSAIRPFEAWLEARFAANSAAVRAGIIDLNSQFDQQQTGALFINSSHGIGPDFSQSGDNGPSIFPTTTTGLTAEYRSRRWSVRAGAFNAVAGDPADPRRIVVPFPGQDGLLLVGELERRFGEGNRAYAGVWHYTRAAEPIGGPGQPGHNTGVYGALEHRLATRGNDTLDGWLRLGLADGRLNAVRSFVGGGLTWGRDERRIGLAFSVAEASRALRRAALPDAPLERAEAIIEATAALAVHPRLTIQPDVQYVISPGWIRGSPDAVVVGVRLDFALF
jgi:porin